MSEIFDPVYALRVLERARDTATEIQGRLEWGNTAKAHLLAEGLALSLQRECAEIASALKKEGVYERG